MKKKIFGLLTVSLIFTVLFASCANPPYASDFSGFTYFYQGEGYGGMFSITINEDGTYSYFEGPDSEYIGIGTWEIKGSRIRLTDRGDVNIVNYFNYEKGYIIYSSAGSTGFTHVDIKNGDTFRKIVPDTTDPVIPG